MKYTKEERLLIGAEIYSHQLTMRQAAQKYQINPYTARDYMREYRDEHNLPPKEADDHITIIAAKKTRKFDDLNDMDRKQLIDEVIKARIEAERAKKGYIVKGDGPNKEFIILNNKNSK